MNFFTADSAEIDAAGRLFAQGDADAIAFFESLFQPEEPCFTCGKSYAPGGVAGYIPSPSEPGTAIILPYCATCRAEAPMYRLGATLRMLRTVWPEHTWRIRRAVPRHLAAHRVRR